MPPPTSTAPSSSRSPPSSHGYTFIGTIIRGDRFSEKVVSSSPFQAACAFFAFQRYKAGSDTAFSQGLAEGEEGDYQGYPTGTDDGQYSEPPFGGGGQEGMGHERF